MLNLDTSQEIAAALGCTEDYLMSAMRRVNALSVRLTITDLSRPERRPREVIDPTGPLRAVQKAIHKKLLLPRLDRFAQSHGGVPGRSQLTCVAEHIDQKFVYCADIQNFYPSIHFERVRRLYRELGCSEEAARVLTRVCTHNNRLEQGFITSPILADRLFRRADESIYQFCIKRGLRYTRYVDDITISGPFSFKRSGIPRMLARLLSGKGFRLNRNKNQVGSIRDGDVVLGMRLSGGRPDVSRAYYEETVRRVQDMASLGDGGPFAGPFFTRAELFGRIRYVCWINPNRLVKLMPLWRSLVWPRIEGEAARRGIVARRTRFRVERIR